MTHENTEAVARRSTGHHFWQLLASPLVKRLVGESALASNPMTAGVRSEPESFRQVIDGVELHWSVRGTGSDIVVLHGLSDSERTWWPVMEELGRHHRVFGLDLPGCGLSGRPDASYSLDWQAKLVATWLDRVGIATCDVVGHSFGGGVAMWLLLYRPNSIRRLALVAPGGLGREVAIELRLAALPFVVERCGQPWMGAVTRLLTHLNGRSLPTDECNHLRHMNTSPGTARAFSRTVRDVIGWHGQTRSFLSRAQEIRALPAMTLFWGENDRIIPIRHGEELCSRVANCTLECFPGAGHFLHWEEPEALAKALLRYIDAPHAAQASLRGASAAKQVSRRHGIRALPSPRVHIIRKTTAIVRNVIASCVPYVSSGAHGTPAVACHRITTAAA